MGAKPAPHTQAKKGRPGPLYPGKRKTAEARLNENAPA